MSDHATISGADFDRMWSKLEELEQRNRMISNAREERRYCLFGVTPFLMAQVLAFRAVNGRRQHDVTIDGLPENYEIGAVAYDFPSDSFLFQVFHESFVPVAEGQRAPELKVMITAHYRDADATATEHPGNPKPAGPKKSWEFLGAP